ncbi:delta subunit of the central stalk of mitochondrial F1F0 ATP synthase, atp16, partial [Cladochytrium tenue]
SFATEAAAPTATPGKLLLNFAVPHQSILNSVEATQVNVQTSGGDMGILSDHVPSISQLNAGVVEILGLESGKPQKYFVSGGFAIINADSTLNINAVEAFPLEELDAEAARRGLEEATRAETASGASEADKATARIERETFEAILYSLAQNTAPPVQLNPLMRLTRAVTSNEFRPFVYDAQGDSTS